MPPMYSRPLLSNDGEARYASTCCTFQSMYPSDPWYAYMAPSSEPTSTVPSGAIHGLDRTALPVVFDHFRSPLTDMAYRL